MIVHELPTITSQVVGIDIETTGDINRNISNPWQDRMVSVAVSDGQNVYIIPPSGNFHSVVPLLENPNIKKIGHNLQFDMSFLIHQLGANPTNLFDTMLMSRLIYAGEGRRHGLDDCLAYELGETVNKSIREQFMYHQGNLTEEQVKYISEDVTHLPNLREAQVKKLSVAGLGKVAKLENETVLAITDMYLTGVRYDQELWEEYKQWISSTLETIRKEIQTILGCNFQENFFGETELSINLNSVKQLKNSFTQLKIPLHNTKEETIKKYVERNPDTDKSKYLELILGWKKWRKMLGWNFEQYVNPVTGCIHPSWNQLQADTGRTSCSKPNLQQVPRPSKTEPNFRSLFKPQDGKVFIVADFGQQEVRVLAQLCGDMKLREACEKGDVYSQIAQMVFNKPVEKGSEERFLMKTAILACAYGAREKKLAAVLNKPEEEVKSLRSIIFSTFPEMKNYADRQLRTLIQRGYVSSQLGRRRYFLEIRSENPNNYWKFASQAVNTPVQGTAADIGKLALCKFREYYNKVDGVSPALYIHDEIVAAVDENIAEEAIYQLIGAMEAASDEICPDVKVYSEATISNEWDKV